MKDSLYKLALANPEGIVTWNCITDKIRSTHTKSEPIKVFFDIDVKLAELCERYALEKDAKLAERIRQDAIQLVEMIQDYINSVTKKQCRMLVAHRLDYKLHIHFPEIIMDPNNAKDLAMSLEKHLAGHAFQKMVDVAVYTSGLRWIWCHKGQMIKGVKKIREEEAAKALHEQVFGKYTYRNFYTVVDPHTFTVLSLERGHLDDTCIVFPVGETPEINFTFVPSTLATLTVKKSKSSGGDLVKSKKQKIVHLPTSMSCDVSDDEGESKKPELKKQLSEADAVHVCQFIKDRYNATVINAVLTFGESIVVSFNSPHCPFKKASHGSNVNQKIVINVKGASQRCYSTSRNECKNGRHGVIVYDQFPDTIKTILSNVCEDKRVIELNSLPRKYFSEIEKFKEINWKLSAPLVSINGPCYKLTENTFCPCCNTHHDQPRNTLCMRGKLLYLECDETKRIYPNPPIQVTLATYNTLNYSSNTVINNYNTIGDSTNIDIPFDTTMMVQDDPELNRLLLEGLCASDSDLGNAVFYIAKDTCAIDCQNHWWAWMQKFNRWKKSEVEITRMCSQNLVGFYQQIQAFCTRNTQDRELREKQVARIAQIIKRLKASHDLKNILSMAKLQFEDHYRASDGFMNLLDNSPHLLAFENGVYDLTAHEFRETASTDYITFSTGYSFESKVDPDIRAKILQFIKSIMPTETEVHYLLVWLASCLDGYNSDEIFTIWTGNGRNGKGALCDLVNAALGIQPNNYATSVNVTLLTHDRPGSSQASPDVLALKGKRIVFATEPEKNMAIKAGMVKHLTGNDIISGRQLYSSTQASFRPQHSIVMQCNAIPKLDCDDDALWDRCRIIHFPYKFVKTPTQENEKVIDTSLKQEVTTWGPQMMLLLLEYYVVYKREGLQPTEAMLTKIGKTREENDAVLNWIREHYEQVPDQKCFIPLTTMGELFKLTPPSDISTTVRNKPCLGDKLKSMNLYTKQSGTRGAKGLRLRPTTTTLPSPLLR